MVNVRIWSGEHHAWWRPDRISMEYTTVIEDAGLFDAEDALARTTHCGPEEGIRIVPDGYVALSLEDFKNWYQMVKNVRRDGDTTVAPIDNGVRRTLHPAPLRPNLNALIEAARNHVMTPEEMFEQRISFVHGQMMDCAPHLTKDDIRRIAIEMYGAPPMEWNGF